MIQMPDGTGVQLTDWVHEAYYTSMAHYLLEEDPVRVQPGYTHGPGYDPGVPDPISLDEFATRINVSPWRLRTNVAEYKNLEAKGRRRAAERVRRRLSSLLYADTARPRARRRAADL